MGLSIETAAQRAKVGINTDNFKALSNTLGLSETDLEVLKISIEDKGVSGYLPSGEEVIIAIGGELNALEAKKSILRRICENPDSNLSLVDKFVLNDNLYTRRLPQYLLTAPPERALPFAERILLNRASRGINQILLHEMKHVSDIKKNSILGFLGRAHVGYNLLWVGSGLVLSYLESSVFAHSLPAFVGFMVGLGIFNVPVAYLSGYAIDPLEISARLFVGKHKNNPEFRVISLQTDAKLE